MQNLISSTHSSKTSIVIALIVIKINRAYESAGHLVDIDVSSRPSNLLPGIQLPSIWWWLLKSPYLWLCFKAHCSLSVYSGKTLIIFDMSLLNVTLYIFTGK